MCFMLGTPFSTSGSCVASDCLKSVTPVEGSSLEQGYFLTGSVSVVGKCTIWVWLKTKQEGLRRFWSMFTVRVPFEYRFFEPQRYR